MNEIAIQQGQEISLSSEQVELIKTTICKGATDEELKMFLYVSKKSGLDPMARQVYAIKRWDAQSRKEIMTIQTGIDGYRLIAARTCQHLGTDDALFTVDENGLPISATVAVYKLVGNTKCAFYATARYDEYKQTTKEGVPTKFWLKMPFSQLAKCAEALALRKAFPQELSGIYTHDEMGQADNPVVEKNINIVKEIPAEIMEGNAEPLINKINECKDINELYNLFCDQDFQQEAKKLSASNRKKLTKLKDEKKEALEKKIQEQALAEDVPC